ncbi:MAG: hypothetical protein Q4E03_01265 [Trueperella sp.]|nr:hypothetical protein [Trueperella sp.]
MQRKPQLHPAEPGMVSVLAAALIAVGIAVAALLMQFIFGAYRYTELRGAADLAAVSAAQVLAQTGSAAQACGVVPQLMPAAGNPTIDCAVQGRDVAVTARAPAPVLWLGTELTVRAVAGPSRS